MPEKLPQTVLPQKFCSKKICLNAVIWNCPYAYNGNKKSLSRTLRDFTFYMVRPRGLEPPARGLGNRCSIRLSYGRTGYDALYYNTMSYPLRQFFQAVPAVV